MNKNREVIKGITKTPVLVVQDCNDRLVKSSATFELFDDITAKDKTFLSVPYEHLIFEEQEHVDKRLNDTVIRLLAVWLTSHVSSTSSSEKVQNNQEHNSVPQALQHQLPKKSKRVVSPVNSNERAK